MKSSILPSGCPQIQLIMVVFLLNMCSSIDAHSKTLSTTLVKFSSTLDLMSFLTYIATQPPPLLLWPFI